MRVKLSDVRDLQVNNPTYYGGWRCVDMQGHGKRRWSEMFTVILQREDDGSYWSYDYDSALTEMGEDEWPTLDLDETIELSPVSLIIRTVKINTWEAL